MERGTLILARKDVEEIISIDKTMKAVEAALKQEFEMPPKIYLTSPKGDFRAMPVHLGKYVEIKWVSVYPENKNKGLPTVIATIILNDAATSLPLAVMDGTLITNYRTGAIGGIASKYLARKSSKSLGLVGAGAQARTQLLAISRVFDLSEVRVYDLDEKKRETFAREMSQRISGNLLEANSIRECVSEADIVSTTTPSREPIVLDEWIQDGTHINAIGADAKGKEELDPKVFRRAKIVVDDIRQAVHGGEINVPIEKGIITERDVAGTIMEVVKGKKIRERRGDVTVFCSTGLAVQDVATAAMVYEEALKKGLGKRIELF
ncbi:ornithine cyclodeaminase family protein [Candidatus Micrarchaeota archaeon]|nr:ornithine cyclodeaminase family protein [Candidatus Micrarchaeota archaeon]